MQHFARWLSLALLFIAGPLHAQAVDLQGQSRIKTSAIGGIRTMGVATPPENLSPFWHAENDESGTVEASLTFSEDGSCAVNLFARVSDPEDDSIILTEPEGDWPTGCTVDYDNGLISSIATTAGTGAVTVRACEDADDTKCDDWEVTWEVIAAGSAPFVVSNIPDQFAFQGVAFSYDTSVHFDDPNGDPLTFTSADLPVGGITISSAGVVSGTPSAAAVSASPISITVNADDGGADVDDTFSLVVSAVPGDTFGPYGAGVTVIDCNSPESITTKGNGAGPGDLIILDGVTRSSLVIRDCAGSASSPITVTNDTTDSGPAILERTSGGAVDWLECINCTNLVLDGTGKWSGAPAGTCGVTVSGTTRTEGRTQCGIVLQTDGSATCPVAWIRYSGLSSKYTIKGVEIDGTGCTGGPGVGFTANDGQIKNGYSGSGTYTGNWREDITITQNYIHDTGETAGEGMYFGPNANQDELPLRRLEVSYNLVEDVGADGIEVKYWLQGPNYIRFNHVYRTGNANPLETGQHKGIGSIDGGDVEIYGNYVEDAGSAGISCSIQDTIASGGSLEPDVGPYYCLIYNNIVKNAGIVSQGNSVNFTRSTSTTGGTRSQISPARATHNTSVTPDGKCVNIASSISGTKSSANNICAGSTAQQAISGVTDTTSLKGAVSSMGFSDAANDNYHLAPGSVACNSIGSSAGIETDFDGQVRPSGALADRGADENASCL